MGISITSPSQIPVNVVEIGNEISQNAINAISASNNPSTGNPFTTTSTATGLAAGLASNAMITRTPLPSAAWAGPFPIADLINPFYVAFNAQNGSWYPTATAGTLLAFDYSSGTDVWGTYNFDFTDGIGNWISLSGSAVTGTNYSTVYFAKGYFDVSNSDSWVVGTGGIHTAAGGPNSGSFSNSIVATSSQFYDSNSGLYMYRYVYHDGSGGFYTADNYSNPPN
jgi:hypothetical protein